MLVERMIFDTTMKGRDKKAQAGFPFRSGEVRLTNTHSVSQLALIIHLFEQGS